MVLVAMGFFFFDVEEGGLMVFTPLEAGFSTRYPFLEALTGLLVCFELLSTDEC